mmetsp:Transcript_12479/g.43385  ORF Transcript_12479/g.43385 Transcript_12479/m.43385 type:complete len:230 (-) Transcript_12479:6-695(-)
MVPLDFSARPFLLLLCSLPASTRKLFARIFPFHDLLSINPPLLLRLVQGHSFPLRLSLLLLFSDLDAPLSPVVGHIILSEQMMSQPLAVLAAFVHDSLSVLEQLLQQRMVGEPVCRHPHLAIPDPITVRDGIASLMLSLPMSGALQLVSSFRTMFLAVLLEHQDSILEESLQHGVICVSVRLDPTLSVPRPVAMHKRNALFILVRRCAVKSGLVMLILMYLHAPWKMPA